MSEQVIEINLGVSNSKTCKNCVFWSSWGEDMPGWGRCRSAASKRSGDDTKARGRCSKFKTFEEVMRP